jgi:hypothetical protein
MRALFALRALFARHPSAATALLGAASLGVAALGLACLVTGLADPTSDRGIALVVLGALTLLVVCWVVDVGIPTGMR